MNIGTSKAQYYQFGEFRFVCHSLQLWREDTLLPLPPLSRSLLLALLEAAPQVLTYEAICTNVWAGRPVSPSTVTQRIKLLRHTLSDDGHNPRYIKLVRGIGYRMVQHVSVQSHTPDSVVSASAPWQVHKLHNRRRWWKVIAPLGVVIGLAIMGMFAWHTIPERNNLASTQAQEQAQEEYRIGLAYYHRRNTNNIDLAEKHFHRALANDPTHVDALIKLAAIYKIKYFDLGLMDRQSSYRLQRDYLTRALTIDPNSGEALARFANFRRCTMVNPPNVQHDFEKAYRSSPDNPIVLALYAGYLDLIGKQSESFTLQQKAITLRPESFLLRSNLAIRAIKANDLAIAENQLAVLESLYGSTNPDLAINLAYLHVLLGRAHKAVEYLEYIQDEVEKLTIKALAFSALNQHDAARAALMELQNLPGLDAQIHSAEVLVFRNQPQEASRILESLYQSIQQPMKLQDAIKYRIYDKIVHSPFLSDLDDKWYDKIIASSPVC